MTSLVWANFPLALLFLLAWSGIPLWIVIKHPDTQPDFSDAHPYLAAKAARPGITCVRWSGPAGAGFSGLAIDRGAGERQPPTRGIHGCRRPEAGHPGLGLSDVAQTLRLDVAPGTGTKCQQADSTGVSPVTDGP
jgi:hypothetical protein